MYIFINIRGKKKEKKNYNTLYRKINDAMWNRRDKRQALSFQDSDFQIVLSDPIGRYFDHECFHRTLKA